MTIIFDVVSLVRFARASSVPNPCLKPYWETGKELFSFK